MNILPIIVNKKILGDFATKSLLILKDTSTFSVVNFIDKSIITYPKSIVELMNSVASERVSKEYTKDLFYIEGVMGSITRDYNPIAIKKYINPYNKIQEIVNNSSGNEDYGVFVNKYFTNNLTYENYKRYMDDYTQSFISYWTTLGDNLSPNFHSYKDFNDFVLRAKAQDINNALYNIYDTSSYVISNIQDKYLSKNIQVDKTRGLENIDARKAILNINYSDRGTELLSYWADLPQDATEANRYLLDLDNKTTKTTLLSMVSSESGNVPWWRNLIDKGIYFVKKDAKNVARVSLKEYQNQFNKFPIYAQGDPKKALSIEDMRELRLILDDFNWQENIQEEISTKRHFQIKKKNRSESIRVWGEKVSKILEDLTTYPVSIEYTLYVLDDKTQDELVLKRDGEFAASPRFRFADFIVDGYTVLEKFSTTSSKEKRKIFSGVADTSNIEFKFYTHSDSKNAQDTISFFGHTNIKHVFRPCYRIR